MESRQLQSNYGSNENERQELGKKKTFKTSFVSSGMNMVHGSHDDNILASMHNDLNDQGDTLNAKRSSEIGSRAGSSYA